MSALLCLALLAGPPPALRAVDLSANYQWRPVRLGAGGFVTGFVTHPLEAGVRYCRTDVGNAYRWDGGQWVPMIVRNANGTGLPAVVASARPRPAWRAWPWTRRTRALSTCP